MEGIRGEKDLAQGKKLFGGKSVANPRPTQMRAPGLEEGVFLKSRAQGSKSFRKLNRCNPDIFSKKKKLIIRGK